MSDYLRKYLADEDESIRAICNDPDCDGKMIMWMHNKTVCRNLFEVPLGSVSYISSE